MAAHAAGAAAVTCEGVIDQVGRLEAALLELGDLLEDAGGIAGYRNGSSIDGSR